MLPTARALATTEALLKNVPARPVLVSHDAEPCSKPQLRVRERPRAVAHDVDVPRLLSGTQQGLLRHIQQALLVKEVLLMDLHHKRPALRALSSLQADNRSAVLQVLLNHGHEAPKLPCTLLSRASRRPRRPRLSPGIEALRPVLAEVLSIRQGNAPASVSAGPLGDRCRRRWRRARCERPGGHCGTAQRRGRRCVGSAGARCPHRRHGVQLR
mmetsp:Transcript_65131/g.139511  ORF Transcript_65131/g.139511 Transcript_65131/m.139511 type:complete len:213 (+) Transcript_65131:190-828(+)